MTKGGRRKSDNLSDSKTKGDVKSESNKGPIESNKGPGGHGPGLLFLGLPTRYRGLEGDHVVWNAHRLYGAVRWPLVTTNWNPLEFFGGDEEMSGHTVGVFERLSE